MPAFYDGQRRRYAEAFRDLGLELYSGDGGFYHWCRLTNGMTAAEPEPQERMKNLTPEQRERMMSATPEQRERFKNMTPEERQALMNKSQ